MPKNKGRGGKNYRRGKNENLTKRTLEVKEEGQDYAHVWGFWIYCLGDQDPGEWAAFGAVLRRREAENGAHPWEDEA